MVLYEIQYIIDILKFPYKHPATELLCLLPVLWLITTPKYNVFSFKNFKFIISHHVKNHEFLTRTQSQNSPCY